MASSPASVDDIDPGTDNPNSGHEDPGNQDKNDYLAHAATSWVADSARQLA
ncbi:hypothetical protein [Glutamicibacter halophytocola]|uniref:hypothetical protein n=1 Tax=Glutamicibacter halophytocola TaxID=1933880 RepID=UPI001648C8D5|nr:hypothetical protein [Glutamicibacter halophytocola]